MTKSIKNKEKAINFIELYCRYLYKYLNDTKTCFISGAFVIDDQNNKLKPLLKKAKSYQLSKLLPKTHHDFIPYEKEDSICQGICEIHLTPSFKAFCNKNNKEFKGNVKWYTFNNLENKEGGEQRFIYFKLEQSKTLSHHHIKNAFLRYVVHSDHYKSKSESESDTNIIHRREDCRIENNCNCKKYNRNCEKKYKSDPEGILINNQNKCIPNFDKHIRIGDEYFINNTINDTIIEHINENMNLDNFKINICNLKDKDTLQSKKKSLSKKFKKSYSNKHLKKSYKFHNNKSN
jgi:hypothetical protein